MTRARSVERRAVDSLHELAGLGIQIEGDTPTVAR
jgi:hypothetical protein